MPPSFAWNRPRAKPIIALTCIRPARPLPVKRGHGTQFGLPVPTLDNESDALAFVRARVLEGSDYIKIIYDTGATYGIDFQTLTVPMLNASIAAAHEFDKLAVAHVGSRQGAQYVIAGGADGLVHLFADSKIDAELVGEMKQRGVFVVPTCTVLQPIAGESTVESISRDPDLGELLTEADLISLKRSFPKRPGASADYEHVKFTIGELAKAGIPILAGTDATNPGTAHGASMHHELELLVDAGLTPEQALAAATSLAAKHFKLDDRGRIGVGLRADLVLVKGDPARDIKATRRIARVWKAGHEIDRQSHLELIAQQKAKKANGSASNVNPGAVSDFDQGEIKAAFGAGWAESTDKLFGGSSTVELQVAAGGAEDSKHSLQIAGDVQQQQPAFSGTMFSPGRGGKPTGRRERS